MITQSSHVSTQPLTIIDKDNLLNPGSISCTLYNGAKKFHCLTFFFFKKTFRIFLELKKN